MPLNVSWGNEEHTYTIFEFVGKWTWEEYHNAVKEGYELTKDIPHMVNILLDISKSNLFPSNMLSHFGSSMQHPPREFDLAVVVSQSGFVNAIAGIIDSLYGKKGAKFKVVKTLEEGRALLADYDRTHINPGTASGA